MALSEERLAADLQAAMKARDPVRRDVLRGLLAAAKHQRVEQKSAHLSEAELTALVRKELRKREEAGDFAARAGRQDLVAQNAAERAVLEAYLPAPLDAGTLEAVIRELAAEPGATLAGVMAALKVRWAGRYDGKTASELARRALAATLSVSGT